MNVSDILEWLDRIAPFETAEGFDNVGLLAGDPSTKVRRVLFGMDLTLAMVEEAIAKDCNVIITHHPFLFHAIKRISTNAPQGEVLTMVLTHGIQVIAAHTNWDRAQGGVCDSLARALGLSELTSPDPYIRLGSLAKAMTPDELSVYISKALGMMPRCYAPSAKAIHRIAVSGGAYGEGYEAALIAGAQAYVVGEIAHHEIVDATQRGLIVYDAGHFSTEWHGVIALYERFCAEMLSSSADEKAILHTRCPYVGQFPALP